MSNEVITMITAATVAVVVWGWMKLAYIGRSASQPTRETPLSGKEKVQQLILEIVLVVFCILLFLWWKQP